MQQSVNTSLSRDFIACRLVAHAYGRQMHTAAAAAIADDTNFL